MGKIHTKLKRIAALMLCAALMALSGCSESEAALPQGGELLTLGMTEELDTLNPIYAQSDVAQEFFLLVYDPLWRLDASGEPVNCLVENYSLSSDQLTWTIRLRRDVTFSDGEPLTAADVRFTYEQMIFNSNHYYHCFDGITNIRCPDKYTVVITTSYVKGDMQYNQIPILPRHIWSDYTSNPRAFDNEEMIGSGPFYRLMEDSGPQEISWTFQAKANYFNGAAQIGQVKFVYFSTETGAGRAVASGEVDGAIGLSDVQLTTLEGVPGVELIQNFLPGSQVWALAFNMRGNFFVDLNMRQVVEYCVDRERILSMSTGSSGMPGSVWASPGSDYFYNLVNVHGVDRDGAKTMLSAAGYVDSDQNGKVESVITREDMTLKLYISTRDTWSATAATIITENLSEIGLAVDWESTDGPVEDKCKPNGKWDMCVLSWNGSINPVVAAQRFCASVDSLTGWNNAAYEQVFAQLQSATDEASIQSAAGQLQQIFYEDCPYVILGYQSDIQAVRSDRWTGYEDVLNAAGAVFGIGCLDAYMSIAPVTGK